MFCGDMRVCCGWSMGKNRELWGSGGEFRGRTRELWGSGGELCGSGGELVVRVLELKYEITRDQIRGII